MTPLQELAELEILFQLALTTQLQLECWQSVPNLCDMAIVESQDAMGNIDACLNLTTNESRKFIEEAQ